jgi:hypothetical protein
MCIEKLGPYERLGVDHFIVYGAIGTEHAQTMKSPR